MLKLEIHPVVGVKARLENLLDAAIDLIVRFTDYTIYRQITLAEGGLFAWAFFRTAWFLIVGVANANFDFYFSDSAWTAYFAVVTALHFSGFFVPDYRIRFWALNGYALAWGVLLILAAYSRTAAPAVPSYLTLFLFSFVVLVRISRKKDENGE